MRFLWVILLLGTITGAGCAHRKSAAPQENFSDVPGLPSTPVPPPVEVKQKPKPIPAPAAVEAKRKPKPKPQPKETKIETVSTPAEPKSSSQKLIVTPETGLVGKVETANQNLRYVVLSFPIGHLPAMEQRLNVYRHGLKVGEVKVTGPQIEDNVVADIVEGDSGPGDEVRDK